MNYPFPNTPIRIYLAGKITKNGWRRSIVPGLRSAWQGICLDEADPGEVVPVEFEIGDEQFLYAGPYFVGCDHGCFHGPGSHGIVDLNSAEQAYRVAASRQAAFSLCLGWLRQAEAVFAHIDSADAHGSQFELGWAHGRLPVYLNFATEELASECWFAAQGARRVSIHADPREAFLNFLPWISRCRERN